MPTAGRVDDVSDNASPSRLLWTDGSSLLAALAVTVVGVVLIVSAPFDGPARTTLGTGLLTGVVVGTALVLLERRLDARRRQQEDEITEGHRRAYAESARNSLVWLLGAYAELMWTVLERSAPASWDQLSMPPCWKGEEDRTAVTRSLIWVAELARADPAWADDPQTRSRVDAVLYVATDLGSRFQAELSEDDLSGVSAAGERTIDRLLTAADRLSQLGDPQKAKRLEDGADAIATRQMPSYEVELSGWAAEGYDVIIEIGPLPEVRSQTSWIIDQLRTDAVAVRSDGKPRTRPAPDPVTYRWSPLLSGCALETDAVWNARFADRSWFRSEVLDVTAREVPLMFGITNAGGLA